MNIKFTEEMKQLMCNDYLNTKLSIDEICEKYGIAKGYFVRIRKQKNITRRKNPNVKRNAIEVNENYFEIIDNSNKAYWLGFIAADGCILRDREYLSLRIVLASKDSNHLEKFKNDIEAKQEIKFTETYDKRTDKTYNSHGIRIARRKICEDLIKHGVGPDKSKELHIPKTIPENLISDFIRGYSDGDGSYSLIKKGNTTRLRYSIISSTKALLEEIQEFFLKNLNVLPTKIIEYPNKSAYKIYYYAEQDLKRIYDCLYDGEGPRLDRKYELSTNYFNSQDHLINLGNIRKKA